MKGVKIVKEDAVSVGGILFVKFPTHIIEVTKITPYIQIGGEDREIYDKEMYTKYSFTGGGTRYADGLRIHQYKGTYKRAFFFYPATTKDWIVISNILAQAPEAECQTHTNPPSEYKSKAVQMPIAFEGEEEPTMTLIVIHYKDE